MPSASTSQYNVTAVVDTQAAVTQITDAGKNVGVTRYAVTSSVVPVTYVPPSAAALTFTGENKDAGTLKKGHIVASHSSGVGVVKANATDNTKNAVGFILADVAPTFAATVETEGLLILTDWTDACGTATLQAKGRYFLDSVAGKMTLSPPESAGMVVQLLGVAVDTVTLDIRLEDAVIL